MAERSSAIVLYVGIASNRPRRPGVCAWCGEPIRLRDPSDYRRRRRVRHRGDRHELGRRRPCDRLEQRSRYWSARKLIVARGDPECVECGDETGWWDADHDVALADGGAHCATNVVRRCVPCHKRKTAREAAARAARRHRLFETTFPMMSPGCSHGSHAKKFSVYEHGKWRKTAFVPVYGHGGGKEREEGPGAMGIDWMTRGELVEAIPPEFTAHVGSYLLTHLQATERSRLTPKGESWNA